MDKLILVTDLHKTFTLSAKQRRLDKTSKKTVTAVDGLSFEVGRGEIFGLLGPNGAGKTTTLRMSTGMKQKTALAVSLVHNPNVIIFDEPTNGLDVITAKTVTDFLLTLKAKGRTIVLSTHIFSLIEKVCDRVGVIINGKMAACGDLAAVCAGKNLEDRFFDIYTEMVVGK